MKIYVGVWDKKQAQYANRFMYSVRRLMKYKNPIDFDNGDWLLDSGGFSEICLNNKYTYSIDDYLKVVELHNPYAFFNMDFMCEPSIVKNTGLSIKEHQEKTIQNQIKIMDKIDNYNISSKFIGVVQGWNKIDYMNHIDMLKEQDLILDYMGIGTICRRNSTKEILDILYEIKQHLPKTYLHGFGVKTTILKNPLIYDLLYSCDSMSWSFDGRYVNIKPCGDCIYPQQKNCGNCYKYMVMWYNNLIKIKDYTKKQTTLDC